MHSDAVSTTSAGGLHSVAAPVHGAVVHQAAQCLRRHRALHRMEAGQERVRLPGRRRNEGARGIAEIPAEMVRVAEDVAARARLVAVGRAEAGVEVPAPVHDPVRGRVHADAREPALPEAVGAERLDSCAVYRVGRLICGGITKYSQSWIQPART